jgi:hypothetical protein
MYMNPPFYLQIFLALISIINVKVIDVKRFIHISSFFNKLQKIFSTNPIVRREMILKYYS